MKRKKSVTWLFAVLFFGMVLTLAWTAAAQHVGGLGVKTIPLNIADVEQLLKIPGMTDDLAEAIVEYREKSGFFEKPEDLLKVPGMTEDLLQELDPRVGSEGDLYCVAEEGEDEDDEDEDIPLAPSKC